MISSELAAENYTNTKMRVGAPPLPCFPLYSVTPDAAYLEPLKRLEKQFLATLKAHEIPVDDEFDAMDSSWLTEEGGVFFICRVDPVLASKLPLSPEMQAESLTILAVPYLASNVDGSWLRCVDDMRKILRDAGLPNVRVEIVARERVNPWHIEVLPDGHPAYMIWDDDFATQVEQVLDTDPFLHDKWSSISVVRYGQRHEWDRNPPTVLIRIDNKDLLENDTRDAHGRLRSLLDSHGLRDLEIHFELGKVIPCADFPLHRLDETLSRIIHESYATTVAMSATFGVAESFRTVPSNTLLKGPVGIIAGYLELTPKNGGPAEVLALTTYHGIRPAIPELVVGDADEGDDASKFKLQPPAPDTLLHSECFSYSLLPHKILCCLFKHFRTQEVLARLSVSILSVP